jgi:hypothetical protein
MNERLATHVLPPLYNVECLAPRPVRASHNPKIRNGVVVLVPSSSLLCQPRAGQLNHMFPHLNPVSPFLKTRRLPLWEC